MFYKTYMLKIYYVPDSVIGAQDTVKIPKTDHFL